jgi:hypothetical protein
MSTYYPQDSREFPDHVVPTVVAIGHVVLQATRISGGQVREMKLARVTQNPPNLDGNEVSIKLRVKVPVTVFERGLASITIDVPEELVSEPDVSVVAP